MLQYVLHELYAPFIFDLAILVPCSHGLTMCLAPGALNIVIMIALVTVRLAYLNINHYRCHMSNKFMSDSRMWAWMHRILNRKLMVTESRCKLHLDIHSRERQKIRSFEKEGVACRQFSKPWSVSMKKDESLIIYNSNHQIQKLHVSPMYIRP